MESAAVLWYNRRWNIIPLKKGFDKIDYRRSGAMFEPIIHSEQTELLMRAMLSLTTPEEANRFFEDLCTIAEIK